LLPSSFVYNFMCSVHPLPANIHTANSKTNSSEYFIKQEVKCLCRFSESTQ